MIRTFETHGIRKNRELSSSLWDFCTLEGEHKNKNRKVAVPSCWETYPYTLRYRGKASYAREFEGEGNVRLEFKGVSHTASVYVDGEKVTSHYNAYTPFDVVLKNLASGKHSLEVIVDNSFGGDSALHVDNDYYSYGGISRGVVMEELEDVYIQWVHFTPFHKENTWFCKVETSICNLSNHAFKGNIILHLNEKELVVLPVELLPEETKVIKTEEIACEGVKEWSPEQPALYYISATIATEDAVALDDLIDRVGFREIKVVGKDILLNGKKLYIKGFCRHEDHPQFGCALPFAAIQCDLDLIKDMGGNSVRTAHYPNDEIMLDLCDEQGILVWEEGHARGLVEEDMRHPLFEKQSEDCIREMITAHYNHPSIYIWGIMNECASNTEYGQACYKAQYALIKELDSSRPRSSASCNFKTDICFGFPEVVSFNMYPKWYDDIDINKYLDSLYGWIQNDTEGTGKPFLVTEIGAGAIYGYRTPAKVKWSEDYQAQALEEQLTGVFAREDFSGVYIWQFCDVKVSDGWFSGRPRTMNNKGIVDEYRRPKLAYDVVKKIYHSRTNYRE